MLLYIIVWSSVILCYDLVFTDTVFRQYATNERRSMVNQFFYELGNSQTSIMELFSFGLERAKEIGPENVYDYSIGNPNIPPPIKVNESIKTIVDEADSIKVHGYSVSAGFDESRNAIARDLSDRFGLHVKGSELFITCGAAPALVSVIKALTISPDTEIIIIAPFFPEYKPFINANGSKAVIVSADTESFQIDLSKVENAISKNTQAIIINSPNNPSGVVYSEETLSRLAELLTDKSKEYGHPLYIIADEPYREFVYDDMKVPFIPCIYKNTIVCYSYSKSLSIPGERIGYVYVPGFAENSKMLFTAIAGAARISGHVCTPTLIQKVIECCATERPDITAYDKNRTLLYNSLTEMGYVCAKPEGAFYLFVKAPDGNAVAFSERAKLEHALLVVAGDEFGCPGFFRLSYCVSESMIKRSMGAFRAMMAHYL